MGINLELASILQRLTEVSAPGLANSVVELGAQDLTIKRDVLYGELARYGRADTLSPDTLDVRGFYGSFGFTDYLAIDANGQGGAKVFDLNLDLREKYGFTRTFDLVTNLGTAEHCFNQEQVFANIHALCRPGGSMIHALPSQGWVNHGFFNYNPKIFRHLANANGYEIMEFGFTANLLPRLIPYTLANLRRRDGKDVLLYVVLRKRAETPFHRPFDADYVEASLLRDDYPAGPASSGPQAGEFASYARSYYFHAKYGRRAVFREFAYLLRDRVRAIRRRFQDRGNG